MTICIIALLLCGFSIYMIFALITSIEDIDTWTGKTLEIIEEHDDQSPDS